MKTERSLERKMRLVERLLLTFIRFSVPSVSLGPKTHGEVYPSSWTIFLRVATDLEREQLRQDWNVDRKLRETLARVGYPQYAVTSVRLYVESEETLQRNYEKHGTAAFM